MADLRAQATARGDPKQPHSSTNNGLKSEDDALNREATLAEITHRAIRHLGEKKSDIRIFGYDLDIQKRVAQAAKITSWAKDLIGEAVKPSAEASLAWTAVSIVLPLLINPVMAEEASKSGFDYITTRMRYYAALENSPSWKQGASPDLIAETTQGFVDLYENILRFQIQYVLRCFEDGFWKYLVDTVNSTQWQDMITKVEKLEATIHRNLGSLLAIESLAAQTSRSDTSQKTLAVTQHMLLMLQHQIEISERHMAVMDRQSQLVISERQTNVHQVFRLENPLYEDSKAKVSQWVEGTCKWVLQQAQFQSWQAGTRGPLLVTADPGCGKSVLAKYLVDDYLPTSIPTSETICYFFFQDQIQNSAAQALCAILHQLFASQRHLLRHAADVYNVDGPALRKNKSSLWQILLAALADADTLPVTIIIDAIDECAESEITGFLEGIRQIFNQTNDPNHLKVRCLITSRPYNSIRREFNRMVSDLAYESTSSNKYIDLHIPGEDASDAISGEIKLVIEDRVRQLGEILRLRDDLLDQIAKLLVEFTHRTYLWVYFVFEELERDEFVRTSEGIRQAVMELPKDLPDAYQRILSKCERHKTFVKKVFCLMLAAKKPLSVGEIHYATQIELPEEPPELSSESVADFQNRLTSWCGLFITVHNGRSYFIHQTAKEYLLSRSKGNLVLESKQPSSQSDTHLWRESITTVDSQKTILYACLACLEKLIGTYSEAVQKHGDSGYYDCHPYASHPFYEYSLRFWGKHLQEFDLIRDYDIIIQALRFIDFRKGFALTSARLRRDGEYPSFRRGLHRLALNLQNKIDINTGYLPSNLETLIKICGIMKVSFQASLSEETFTPLRITKSEHLLSILQSTTVEKFSNNNILLATPGHPETLDLGARSLIIKGIQSQIPHI